MFTEAPTTPEKCEISAAERLLARRDMAALFARNAEHLLPAERALVKAYFEDGRSASEIARLAGTSSKTILRRVDRIAARISSPRFAFVLGHRSSLGRTRARVAMACIVNGLSMRAAAREMRLSVYAVRAHMIAVNGMFERVTRVV